MPLPRAVRPIVSRSIPPVRWLLFGLTLGFAGVAPAADDLKVAVVDVARIFRDYTRVKDLQGKIDEASRTLSAELDARREDHHRLVEELARIDKALANPATSAREKDEGQKRRAANVDETRQLELASNDFRHEREHSLQELMVRTRNQIIEEIMVVVNARVESDHYDLVLNASAQGQGERKAVLYANGKLDITDDVLATLNRTHPTDLSTPSAIAR